MLKKYHVITTKQKLVIYGHSVESVKTRVMDFLLCPARAILSIKEI